MALREQRPLGNISMPLATREVAVLKIRWDSWTVNMCARHDSCKTANKYDIVGTMSALPHRYLPTARLLSVPSDIRNPSSWTCQPASELRKPSRLMIQLSGLPSPANLGYPSSHHLHASVTSTHARKHSLHVVGRYCTNRVSFSATLKSKTGHTLLHQCPPISTGVFPPLTLSVFKS